MKNSTVRIEMVTDTCVRCGVPFAMPKELEDWRKQDGRKIYCPNGHKQNYVSEDNRFKNMVIRCRKLTEDNERLKNELAKIKQVQEQAEVAGRAGEVGS